MDSRIETFLSLLWRGAPIGYYWRSSSKMSQWVSTFPLADCALGDSNVYMGVHPTRAKRDKYERGRIEDVACLNCLFCEWDAKDFGDDLGHIRDHIKALPYQPQVIVCSGGGYHGYWFLSDPVELCAATMEYLRGTQAAWVRLCRGDRGAHDLARVLRLPGTVNAKYEPARRVTFVRFGIEEAGSPLYDINDLCHLADDHWDDAPTPTNVAPPMNGERRGRIAAVVKALAEATEGERNVKLHWAACRMYEIGMSEGAAVAELLDTALHIGLNEHEITATIKSASKQPIRETGMPDRPQWQSNKPPMSINGARETLRGKLS